MKKRTLITIAFFLTLAALSPALSYGQNDVNTTSKDGASGDFDLSESQRKDIEKAAVRQVNKFGSFVSLLANKYIKSEEKKDKFKISAMNLFHNPEEVIVEARVGEGKKAQNYLPKYLDIVRDQANLSYVEIKVYKAYFVGSLKPHIDGSYRGVVSFLLEYKTGTKEKKYTELVSKQIEVVVKLKTNQEGKVEFVTLLGDVVLSEMK